ncbi:hypothetical protein ACIQTZ_20880 [Paenarthrobacter sp. NPDC090520]|uniref:hypothetical protein n=1 Tax=Paenarthrobacter sp. NPDC090520 TaxID=3364382 RepID=UPI003810BE49
MDLLAVLAAVLSGPALVALLWIWTRRRDTKRPVKRAALAGVLGIVDEIYRPETHQAHQVQKVQHELPSPAPAPKGRR